jgi:orotate phosphoribosyltransferase
MPSVNEKLIAEKLLEAGAVRLCVSKPFTWASGWKSPIYCDNRKLLSFPAIRTFIKNELCNKIFSDTQAIAGVATAGIPWGALVADQLNLPFMYVRAKPKTHGMGNQIEGVFSAGEKVVMVEDLISTGMSSLEAVAALQANKLEVSAVISIFNYGFQTAIDAFAKAGVPFESLTNYAALIELAIEKNMIKKEEEATLLDWRKQPDIWGK